MEIRAEVDDQGLIRVMVHAMNNFLACEVGRVYTAIMKFSERMMDEENSFGIMNEENNVNVVVDKEDASNDVLDEMVMSKNTKCCKAPPQNTKCCTTKSKNALRYTMFSSSEDLNDYIQVCDDQTERFIKYISMTIENKYKISSAMKGAANVVVESMTLPSNHNEIVGDSMYFNLSNVEKAIKNVFKRDGLVTTHMNFELHKLAVIYFNII